MEASQPSLFDTPVAPVCDAAFRGLSRLWLDDEAWVDHQPGWLRGHATLMDELLARVRWRTQRREMYEAVVEVPRLLARFPEDGEAPPVVAAMAEVLSARYGVAFDEWSVALYRSGADSVAWHGDQVARQLPMAHVVTVSLGAPRRFLLRRSDGPGRHAFSLGWGDLVVMGGACQRKWQHCVPKVPHADPRLVVMFRPSVSFATRER